MTMRTHCDLYSTAHIEKLHHQQISRISHSVTLSSSFRIQVMPTTRLDSSIYHLCVFKSLISLGRNSNQCSPLCKPATADTTQILPTSPILCAQPVYVFAFDILATSKVILRRIPTCVSTHSLRLYNAAPLENQPANTKYPTVTLS